MTSPPEACPRCKLATHVSRKLLLINAAEGHPEAPQSAWRHGCACHGFSIDDLKPDFAHQGPFMQGLYCEACAIGYLPEFMAKPAPPMFKAYPEGYRRVFPDGTLGALLSRMTDDPDLQS